MFDSIYTSKITPGQFFLMAVVSLVVGIIYAWVMSFRIRAHRRFFIVIAIVPFVESVIITFMNGFLNGSVGAGIAVCGAFTLIRFRSAPGSADEIAAILIAMGAGIAFGVGFIAYGVVILVGLGVIFFLLSSLTIFEHKGMTEDRLLRVTIPESLEYHGVFDETFAHYLKKAESMGVKTTGMGSMFRLSFKIQMKDSTEEKAFIDELRMKNGNLEIAILPFTEARNEL